MPDTILRDLQLARPRVPAPPGRPVLPAVPRRALHRAVRRRRAEELRVVRAVLQARRRRDRALGRLDRRPRRGARPAADDDAAHGRVEAARRTCSSSCGWRGGSAGSTCKTVGDVTRLMTMSHRRHPRPVLRVRSGQDRDGAERPDRHVGRPVRAGHRLRDGAPFDRRRRRRPPRRVGGARGRHGRGERRDRVERAHATAPRSARTPASRRILIEGGARDRRRARGAARSSRAPLVVTAIHPKITFLEQIDRERAARRTSSTTSRTGSRAAAS